MTPQRRSIGRPSSGPTRARLVLLTASPVYYQVPLYRRLASNPFLDFTVVFASSAGVRPHDGGYGRPITWDVDLLSGYDYVFLRRADTTPIEVRPLQLDILDVIPTIARLRPEVLWLFGYNSLMHFSAAMLQHLRRRPLLFREEQTLLHPRPRWKSAVKHPLLRILFHNAAGLYIGSNNRDWFLHHGMAKSRMFFVPYCVDNERLQREASALARERDALRHSFGIAADDGPVILSVSRLIPKKQPEFLLEAFRRVREQQRCTLLLVGSGPLQEQLERRVHDDGIPNVVFGGFVNQTEVAKAYAVADIFALASRLHETWGVVVNEAMNFALPVVVSDRVGSARDLVRDGVNGYVADATDVSTWVDRLSRLVRDAGLRARMGSASLERISDWCYDEAERGVVAAVAAMTGRDPTALTGGTSTISRCES